MVLKVVIRLLLVRLKTQGPDLSPTGDLLHLVILTEVRSPTSRCGDEKAPLRASSTYRGGRVT